MEEDLCNEGACIESLSFADGALSCTECASSCDVKDNDDAKDGPAARARALSDTNELMPTGSGEGKKDA